MRAYNFSAGPAVLPEPVLRQAAAEMLDWHGSGMSVMEMSHRGKEFMGIHAKAEADLRTLMAIPPSHRILFLQGGAIAENAIIPMNLLGARKGADYVNTATVTGTPVPPSAGTLPKACRWCAAPVPGWMPIAPRATTRR